MRETALSGWNLERSDTKTSKHQSTVVCTYSKGVDEKMLSV